jgi:hypothetical protein
VAYRVRIEPDSARAAVLPCEVCTAEVRTAEVRSEENRADEPIFGVKPV